MTDLSILPPGAQRAAMYDIQPAAVQPSILHIFERALRDVSLPIERAREIYNLQREIEFDLAEREYIRVRSLVEQELEPVARDASNPQTKSRYATLPQVIQAVRPVYSKHGIIVEFDTADSPKGEAWIKVLAFLSHESGYKRTYHIEMPADGKGAQGRDVMTRTHATGSAVSYGRRYLLLMIFNIAVGGEDDDGNAAGRANGNNNEGSSGLFLLNSDQLDYVWTKAREIADEGKAERWIARLVEAVGCKALVEVPQAKFTDMKAKIDAFAKAKADKIKEAEGGAAQS